MIREKCANLGVTLTPQQEKSLEEFVRDGTAGPWFDELPKDVHFTQPDWDLINQQLGAQLSELPSTIKSIVTDISSILLKSIRSDWKRRKYDIEADAVAFRVRLKNRWERSFDELRLLLVLCVEAGREELQSLRRSRARTGKLKRDTVVRLHARACQVSGEVMALLESGYADGAMARWRTIHELFVVTSLIARGDDQLAARYRRHEVVDAKKAMDLYARDHQRLGYPTPSPEEMREVTDQYKSAIDQYGDSFSRPYGWASELLRNNSPHFSDLQKAAGREDMSSFYKMASYPIHADYKGVSWRLSALGNTDLVLAGSSNAGLEEPGQNMALSLVAITSLLATNSKLDTAIPLATIGLQRDRAIKALISAGRALSVDENKRRKSRS